MGSHDLLNAPLSRSSSPVEQWNDLPVSHSCMEPFGRKYPAGLVYSALAEQAQTSGRNQKQSQLLYFIPRKHSEIEAVCKVSERG